ncbi:MAG: GumC family protein [Chlamydiota bacterium]
MNNKTVKQTQDMGLGGLEYYGPKEYRRLLLRRKWMILYVTLGLALATAVGIHFWPDSYRANAVVVVDPGKVPQSFVRSTATIPAAERLAILQSQILSDARLSQVIDELGLYPELKDKTTPDQILLRMRKDIEVQPVSFENLQKVTNPMRAGLQAFTVSFASRNPATAAKVANRLASLFIEENMKARQDEVMGTAEFFDRELAKAKEDLQDKAKKLEELRAKYAANLPDAQNAHIQALTSLEMELRAEMDAMSRAQQQKVYLQSLLAQTPLVVNLDTQVTAQSDSASPEQAQLTRLQGELDLMRSRYGPDYPDVLKIQEEITQLKAKMKPARKADKDATPPPPVGHHNPVLESQIAQLDQEMQAHADREKQLQSEIAYHQSKLEGAPAAQQQLATANRDYDDAEKNYQEMQQRKFAADISSDVEIRQKGERFMIVQPAQPPAVPYQPNRPLIDGMALPVALAISILLAVVLEVLDGTVKTRREITEKIAAPVIGEIPWLPTRNGSRQKRVRMLMAAGGSSLLALAYVAALVVSLR